MSSAAEQPSAAAAAPAAAAAGAGRNEQLWCHECFHASAPPPTASAPANGDGDASNDEISCPRCGSSFVERMPARAAARRAARSARYGAGGRRRGARRDDDDDEEEYDYDDDEGGDLDPEATGRRGGGAGGVGVGLSPAAFFQMMMTGGGGDLAEAMLGAGSGGRLTDMVRAMLTGLGADAPGAAAAGPREAMQASVRAALGGGGGVRFGGVRTTGG